VSRLVTDAGTGARSLPLILARELAANLSTPMLLTDGSGIIVYFNEAAEHLVGRTFAELGEMPATDFVELLHLSDVDDVPIERRHIPSGIAYYERRPAHMTIRVTSLDGERRQLESTAYPLVGAGGELHGVVSVFWPESEGS
jgi:PAS domain S-box-containing protein